MALVQSAITVVIFLLILGVLVVIHELGHFVTARLAGVRVLEFGIGFPPRAKVLRSSGETLYTLNWLPIGGFVKLEGEDGDTGDDPRSFVNAALWKKLVILVSGVLMNIVLAFVIFTAIAWFATPYAGVRFFAVAPDSPAQRAGLVGGDAIVAVNGERYEYFGSRSALDALRERAGQTVTLTIVHADGRLQDYQVTLQDAAAVAAGKGALGVSATEDHPFEVAFFGEYTGHDLPTAIRIGTDQTVRSLDLVLAGFGELARSVASNPTAAPPVAGPIGIGVQLGNLFWSSGPVLTIYLAAILSANLALVNILPFPPLDGGRMVMVVLRRVVGERISVRAERMTYAIGFLFLFAFLIYVTGFDIQRALSGG
jgi:regulator of sigma E protease